MSRIRWFFGALYDFIFPPLPACPFCGAAKEKAEGECESCKPEWEKLALPGKQKKPFACYAYDGVVKTAVWQFKYSRLEDMAHFMAGHIADMLKRQKVSADIVSYVPLHKSKRKKRGFDQTQRLAEAVAGEMGLPLEKTLRRIKRTQTQAKLTAENRKQNVKNAFICDADTLTDKKSVIILLDDVLTTGATMAAAVSALNSAGFTHIVPVTFATSKFNLKE